MPTAEEALAALPADVEVDVDGVPPFITPNDDFYRIDTALEVPQLSTSNYTLTVKGLVDNEITLTWQDLLNRPMIERDVTLTCVSNNVGGHYIGNARWIGARLDELLQEAGPRGGADMVVGRSVDGYECGFPLENALDGRDAMIAVAMNGEPLPLEHGFPARLVVPGLYGYVSATKWLTEIELTRFADFEHYWEQRGWAEKAPIKLQSRIDVPKGLAKVAAGDVAVAGVAWAQQVGIGAVEVSIDDGDWQTGRAGRRGHDRYLAPVECTAGRPHRAGTRSRCGRPTATATCRRASGPSRSPTGRAATTRSSSSSNRFRPHSLRSLRSLAPFGRASLSGFAAPSLWRRPASWPGAAKSRATAPEPPPALYRGMGADRPVGAVPRHGHPPHLALLRSRPNRWGLELDDDCSTPCSTTAARTPEKGHPDENSTDSSRCHRRRRRLGDRSRRERNLGIGPCVVGASG